MKHLKYYGIVCIMVCWIFLSIESFTYAQLTIYDKINTIAEETPDRITLAYPKLIDLYKKYPLNSLLLNILTYLEHNHNNLIKGAKNTHLSYYYENQQRLSCNGEVDFKYYRENHYWYFEKDWKLYYREDKDYPEIDANWIDKTTFIQCTRDYSLDKNHVYYKWIIVHWANPSTFKVTNQTFNEDYAIDKNHVFLQWKILPGARPHSFYTFWWTHYSFDGYHIFWEDIQVPVHSPHTFDVIEDNAYEHWIDWQNVYFQNRVIEWADPNSFNSFNCINSRHRYTYDKENVFYKENKLENVDVLSFQWCDWFGKDNKNVFYNGELLVWVDASSWKWMWDYGTDWKIVVYKNQIIPEANAVDFEIVEWKGYVYLEPRYFWKDRHSVFYKWNKLYWFNTTSFNSLGKCEAKVYIDEEIVFWDWAKYILDNWKEVSYNEIKDCIQ